MVPERAEPDVDRLRIEKALPMAIAALYEIKSSGCNVDREQAAFAIESIEKELFG